MRSDEEPAPEPETSSTAAGSAAAGSTAAGSTAASSSTDVPAGTPVAEAPTQTATTCGGTPPPLPAGPTRRVPAANRRLVKFPFRGVVHFETCHHVRNRLRDTQYLGTLCTQCG